MRARRSEIYILTLRPLPGVDGIRSLRRGLKYLLRSCGLRAVTVREHHAAYDLAHRQATANHHRHRREYVTRPARRVLAKDRGHVATTPTV